MEIQPPDEQKENVLLDLGGKGEFRLAYLYATQQKNFNCILI